jgi:hypothetical protein
MTTIKYCSRCAGLLSLLRPKTENEMLFYWATIRQLRPISLTGACDKCGQRENLAYYRLPD